eukprot:scaffold6519_cov18-Tisochrysis_lutea.AAC.1
MAGAVSKELSKLDLGDWNPCIAEAASFLKKRKYSAEPAQLQIIHQARLPVSFRLANASQQFTLLAVSSNELLSAHATTVAAERNNHLHGVARTPACATARALRQLTSWRM